MSSLRRIVSSRANGARSRGPATADGKQRSSANSLRHGLLAKCVVLENESVPGFKALLQDFLVRFDPADGVELGMIEEMVAALWRQRRAWAIETRTMDAAMASVPAGDDELARITGAFAALAGQPQLELIHRYETRLHRMFQRALKNLMVLRSAAEAAPPAPEDPQLPNEPSPISGQSRDGADPCCSGPVGNPVEEVRPLDGGHLPAEIPGPRPPAAAGGRTSAQSAPPAAASSRSSTNPSPGAGCGVELDRFMNSWPPSESSPATTADPGAN